MSQITIRLDPQVHSFYKRIAQSVNLPLEQIIQDALFKLAGELSLEALHTMDTGICSE